MYDLQLRDKHSGDGSSMAFLSRMASIAQINQNSIVTLSIFRNSEIINFAFFDDAAMRIQTLFHGCFRSFL